MPDARAPAPGAGGPGSRSFGALVRLLDVLAGLLSAGLLVVGGLLLAAQRLAPSVLSMAGWGQASGPGWPRVGAQLLVGVGGEVVVRLRGRLGRGPRIAADLAVIVAAVTVIVWAWWP